MVCVWYLFEVVIYSRKCNIPYCIYLLWLTESWGRLSWKGFGGYFSKYLRLSPNKYIIIPTYVSACRVKNVIKIMEYTKTDIWTYHPTTIWSKMVHVLQFHLHVYTYILNWTHTETDFLNCPYTNRIPSALFVPCNHCTIIQIRTRFYSRLFQRP